MLAACAELMALDNHAVAMPAQRIAGLLVLHAFRHLPALPSGTAGRSSSSGGGGGLRAMLFEQLEQSGLLWQLPGQLSSESDMLSRTPFQDSAAGAVAAGRMHKTAGNLLHMVLSLQRMYPSFLQTHAAGRRCMVPAVQLALSSLQYISTAMAQAGRQEWMGAWLDGCWKTGTIAYSSAMALLDALPNKSESGSSSSESHHASHGAAASSSASGSSSGAADSSNVTSKDTADALIVLQAEQTMQMCCLRVVVTMLAQFMQHSRERDAGTVSSSTTTTGSSSSTTGSSDGGSASSRRQTTARDNAVPREQWLPGVLAPTMPAVYSSMLEQLGCSREVGLWLASRQVLKDDSGAGGPSRAGGLSLGAVSSAVSAELNGYQLLMSKRYVQAMGGHLVQYEGSVQTAALHMSLSAINLQWLYSMPPDSLSALEERKSGCNVADTACSHAVMIMQEQEPLQPEQQEPAGARAVLVTANNVVAQLSTAVLQRLLSECRRGESSIGGSSISSSNGSGGVLLQAYQQVVFVLASATVAVLTGSFAVVGSQHSGPAAVLQPPVPQFECCKLLQDGVRLVATDRAATAAALAAAASDGAAVAAPLSSMNDPSNSMLDAVTSLLGGVRPQSGTFVLDVNSPLVELVAAAGDVSSPEALQLFGLLSSLLKLYSMDSSSINLMVSAAAGTCEARSSLQPLYVSTAVTAMVKLAIAQGYVEVGALNSSSTGTPVAGSCTAALPWLMLLGRCCWGAALLMQRWQAQLESEGHVVTLQHPHWFLYRWGLVQNLQLHQSSLADVVQWLAAAGTVQQLTALGYQPEDMQQQLAQAAEALQPLCSDLQTADMSISGSITAVLQAAHEQLLAASRVLACFAIPHACNNPACSNMCGPSEAQLVGGRSCICAGCRTARYCGKACQRAAWRQHRPVCKALAAAAAGVGHAAGGGVAGSPAHADSSSMAAK